MKVLDIEQNSEEWFELKRPNIGGSDSKAIKPLSRGKLKGLVEGSAGFWKFLSGKVAVEKDDEDDRDRGHRLEEKNLEMTNELTGLEMKKAGVWVSDYSKYIHISPDAAVEGDKPDYAMEGKAFDSNKHLMIIYFDLLQKKQNPEEYNPLESLPDDCKDQAVKYFSVNPDLKTLYWSLINERVILPEFEHYVIRIDRAHVEDLISEQKDLELTAVKKRDEIIKFLREELANLHV